MPAGTQHDIHRCISLLNMLEILAAGQNTLCSCKSSVLATMCVQVNYHAEVCSAFMHMLQHETGKCLTGESWQSTDTGQACLAPCTQEGSVFNHPWQPNGLNTGWKAGQLLAYVCCTQSELRACQMSQPSHSPHPHHANRGWPVCSAPTFSSIAQWTPCRLCTIQALLQL